MKVFQIAGAGILMLALPMACAAGGKQDTLSPQDTQPGVEQAQSSGASQGAGKESPHTLGKHHSLSGNGSSQHKDPLQLHFKNANGGYDTYDLETGTWAPGSSEYNSGGSGDLGDPGLNDPLHPGQ